MIIMTSHGFRWVRLLVAGFVLLVSAGAAFAVEVDGVIGEGEYADELTLAGGDFVVYWTLDQDTVHFALRGRTEGWLAIGIDPAVAMDQADMIFGWVDSGGTVGARDCFSTGLFGPHPDDEQLGGTRDLPAFAGSERGGFTSFEFTRPVNTGDPYDKPLDRSRDVRIIWALGDSDDTLSRHVRRGGGTLPLAADGAASGGLPAAGGGAGQLGRDLYSLLYPFHGILMGTAFAFLFVGMFLPRYFKGKKWWLKTHRRVGIAGGVMGVVAVSIAAFMIARTTRMHLRVVHSYVGLATIAMMVYTPSLGHFMLKIRKNPTAAKRYRSVHRWVGRITLLLMAVTIILGLFQAGVL
jgi:hypothetical protein